MKEYMVVSADQGWLTENVNREIQRGWAPQGGVAFQDGRMYQAMVREVPTITFTPTAPMGVP